MGTPFSARITGLAAAVLALALTAGQALAGEVSVAVAANFTEPAKAIAEAFKAATGHTASLSFGASGQFYTQMTHGAPFEVFLSADAERPARLAAEGLAVPASRFTYATGRLVLFSTRPGLVDGKGEVLKTGQFDKIAIADPATAPYGAAAVQAMTRLGVADALAAKTVKGASIAQAWQFVSTGAAELGFVALSQVIKEPGGSRWIVPASLHDPLDQQAVLLKTGEKDPAAVAFIAFLKGPQARAIIKSYGYEVR